MSCFQFLIMNTVANNMFIHVFRITCLCISIGYLYYIHTHTQMCIHTYIHVHIHSPIPIPTLSSRTAGSQAYRHMFSFMGILPKVYNVVFWYKYTLHNDYGNKLINRPINSQSYHFVCVVRTLKIYCLSKSQEYNIFKINCSYYAI